VLSKNSLIVNKKNKSQKRKEFRIITIGL
jgi:hypothetical protein